MFDDTDSRRPTTRTRLLGNVLVLAAIVLFWLIIGCAVLRAMHGR